MYNYSFIKMPNIKLPNLGIEEMFILTKLCNLYNLYKRKNKLVENYFVEIKSSKLRELFFIERRENLYIKLDTLQNNFYIFYKKTKGGTVLLYVNTLFVQKLIWIYDCEKTVNKMIESYKKYGKKSYFCKQNIKKVEPFLQIFNFSITKDGIKYSSFEEKTVPILVQFYDDFIPELLNNCYKKLEKTYQKWYGLIQKRTKNGTVLSKNVPKMVRFPHIYRYIKLIENEIYRIANPTAKAVQPNFLEAKMKKDNFENFLTDDFLEHYKNTLLPGLMEKTKDKLTTPPPPAPCENVPKMVPPETGIKSLFQKSDWLGDEDFAKAINATGECKDVINSWVAGNRSLRINTFLKNASMIIMCSRFYTDAFRKWVIEFESKDFNGLCPDKFLKDRWRNFEFVSFCKLSITELWEDTFYNNRIYVKLSGCNFYISFDGESGKKIDIINNSCTKRVSENMSFVDFGKYVNGRYGTGSQYKAIPKIMEVYYQ